MSNRGKNWSKEDVEYLIDNWGELTPSQIAKGLGRTIKAVTEKAKKLELGSYLANSEYLTFFQIAKMLNVDSHVILRWVENKQFPFKCIKHVGNESFRWVRHDHLIKWLQNNQDLWDSQRVPEYALGIEPEWLRVKRENDKKTRYVKSMKKYTPDEDRILLFLNSRGKSYQYISERINRSPASVEARLSRLKK